MKMRKWRLLCASLAAAGALVMGMPGQPANVAEAMYSAKDAANHWYKTPNEQQKLFMLAIHDGDYATVKDLIDAGLDVNGVYEDGWGGATPLVVALNQGHREIMQLLLENGADPTGYYEFNGNHLLYLNVAAKKHMGLEVIQYLHNWGADINATCEKSDYLDQLKGNALTVLINSAYGYWGGSDDLEVVAYLLDQGINPDVPDKNKETAFVIAVKWRYYELMDLLANRGANVYATNYANKNAAEMALGMNDLQLYKHVKWLMDRGNQPSNYQPPAGAGISGSVAQAKVDRGTSLGKFADLYKKYSDASDKIYSELEAALADTSTGVTKEKLSKENDAIKQLKKLNEKMAKEDPLKGFKGYSVGEREKFTDLFDGLTEYNDAMIALLEYVVVHPTDGDHDQLVHLTAQVIKAQGVQKDRFAAVQEIIQQK